MGHRRSDEKRSRFMSFQAVSALEPGSLGLIFPGLCERKGTPGLEKGDTVLVWGAERDSRRPANQHLGEGNRKSGGQGGRGSGFQPRPSISTMQLWFSGLRLLIVQRG